MNLRPVVISEMSYTTSANRDYLTLYTTPESGSQYSESEHSNWFDNCSNEFERMKKQNPKRQLVDDLRLVGDGEYKEENTSIAGPINSRNVYSAYKSRIQGMNS